MTMKILIAPDSFKGSLSAKALCASVAEGIRRVLPEAELVELPLADGGEGTMENLVHASQGRIVEAPATDPFGRSIRAAYGVLGDGRTAVIELAQASGLTLLTPAERNPLATSTRGTGELIAHALDAGFRRFIVGLGGSATNDGGAGLLQALGAALLDSAGEPLPPGGAALAKLARIDTARLDPRLREASFDVACDVANPLCGPQGASAVFGPQKGATPAMTAELDAALRRFGECVERERGMAVLDAPGAGAAGGTGAALLGFLDARMRSGIEMVLEAVGWERHLSGADLIITGEGKLDAQTLSGKVIAGVCRSAQQHGVPVVALCGGLDLTGADMDRLGLAAAFSIVRGPCSLERAIEQAPAWAIEQAEQIIRLWQRRQPPSA